MSSSVAGVCRMLDLPGAAVDCKRIPLPHIEKLVVRGFSLADIAQRFAGEAKASHYELHVDKKSEKVVVLADRDSIDKNDLPTVTGFQHVL